jgi:predicted GNAT family N-acyltransferase
MIEVKEIEAKETYPLRLTVLRKGIDLPYKFKEDFDEDTFHLGVFSSDELVGIATFIRNEIDDFDETQYQLRGMATLLKVRRKGFGKIIIDEAIRVLKKKKINILWCNARKEAIPFYEKLNFNIIGEEFNVEKVGVHFKMYAEI